MSTLEIYDVEQRTDAWYAARRGLITASMIGKLMTPGLKVAANDTSRTALAGLVAECLSDTTEDTADSWQMARGREDEPYAREAYAEWAQTTVREIGFAVRTWPGEYQLGASPDGLVGDEGMIEIKSRGRARQVLTTQSGVPSDVLPQIQAQLLVMGREWCDYVSYSQGLALFVERVHADPVWHVAILEAVDVSYAEMGRMLATYAKATRGMPVAEIRDMEPII